MNIIELLRSIENKKVDEGSIFHGGDLIYNLIVIDHKLYVINEIAKELQLLDSKIIGNFIVNDYKLYEYKKVLD